MPAIGWITPGLMTIVGVPAAADAADLVDGGSRWRGGGDHANSERSGAHSQPGNFPFAHVSSGSAKKLTHRPSSRHLSHQITKGNGVVRHGDPWVPNRPSGLGAVNSTRSTARPPGRTTCTILAGRNWAVAEFREARNDRRYAALVM